MRKAEQALGQKGRPVPAVALTAHARDEDRAKTAAAGFETHVPKPVVPERLVEVVAALTGRAGKPNR